MTLRRLAKTAARNLYAARQRSALAVLGIVIGIASVIAMVSLGTMARVEALRQFELLGTDVLSLQIQRQPRRVEGFSLADARQVPFRVPWVLRVAPRSDANAKVRYGTVNIDRTIFGVEPDELPVQRLSLTAGRFLTPLDENERVCVLGAKAVADLSAGGVQPKPGDFLTVGGHPYQIVGLLRAKDVGLYGDGRVNEAVYVPYRFAVLGTGRSADVSSATVQVRPDIASTLASDRILAMLHQWKGESVEFQAFVPEQLLKQQEQQMRLYTLLLGIIASISLIVGGVGVMNIMLVSVTERRKEIGLRRAVGAKRRDVQTLFLAESGLLTAVGGIGGAIVGVGAAYIVAVNVGWPPLILMSPVVLGIGVSVSLGIFFGWYPARKAAALLPIEAMRG